MNLLNKKWTLEHENLVWLGRTEVKTVNSQWIILSFLIFYWFENNLQISVKDWMPSNTVRLAIKINYFEFCIEQKTGITAPATLID